MTPRYPAALYADLSPYRLQVVRSFGRGYVAQLMANSEILKAETCRSLSDAQTFLVDELRSRTGINETSLMWKPVYVPLTRVAGPLLLLLTILYGLPTLLEWIALHAGGHFSYLIIGDLFSYVIIFFAGYRWTAISVYLLSRTFEVWLLHRGLVPLDAMLWVTDAVPSVFASALICRKLLFLPE